VSTTASVLLAAACAALGAGLLAAPTLDPRAARHDRLRGSRGSLPPPTDDEPPALLWRFRWLFAALAGCAGVAFVGGATGTVLGVGIAAFVWVAAGRVEPPGVRRRREAVRRGLPHLTRLLGIALASGQSVPAALGAVAAAYPGPAAHPLEAARSALAVGTDPARVWADLARVEGLAPLGRALGRAEMSGAAVAEVVARLAHELAAAAHAEVEDRARTVGVRAAMPLGLCLLPSFLLIGIVPVVAAALRDVAW
jgi:Flp pilus assembly protein TadB